MTLTVKTDLTIVTVNCKEQLLLVRNYRFYNLKFSHVITMKNEPDVNFYQQSHKIFYRINVHL